jgi:UDP:flavonoid glycosyltransferase YjiC (YdhE family)
VPNRRPTVLLYTSSHGFGHAVRCGVLCLALRKALPELRIIARTAAPPWIFPPDVDVESCLIDTGVVQPSSLEIDAQATLERYAAQVTREEAVIEAEVAHVREIGAQVIVGDVPAAAFEIAARAGVPSIGLANFTWDWIYEPFADERPVYAPLLTNLRAQYTRASRLLRLPFHGDMGAFPVVEDIPLIARRSPATRAETRKRFGLPLEAPIVLFSFGGHVSEHPDENRLAQLGEYGFVTTTSTVHPRSSSEDGCQEGPTAIRRGRNLFVLPQLAEGYVDLLAACNVVVTKPGYGIVADLIANRVPALYGSRGGFREEPVLVRALEEEARAVAVERSALDTLDLGPALARLSALDRPWTERPIDGADIAARRILTLAGLL